MSFELYIPLFYNFKIRYNSIKSLIAIFFREILFLFLLSYFIAGRNAILISLLGYVIVISIYEIGYFVNDTKSIKTERNPTIRLRIQLNEKLFIFIRFIFIFIFLYFLHYFLLVDLINIIIFIFFSFLLLLNFLIFNSIEKIDRGLFFIFLRLFKFISPICLVSLNNFDLLFSIFFILIIPLPLISYITKKDIIPIHEVYFYLLIYIIIYFFINDQVLSFFSLYILIYSILKLFYNNINFKRLKQNF